VEFQTPNGNGAEPVVPETAPQCRKPIDPEFTGGYPTPMSSWQKLNGTHLWLTGFVLFWMTGRTCAAEGPAGTRPWREYRTIMWTGDTARQHPEKLPLFFQRLREMGINTGMLYGEAEPKPLVENHMPYYVENVVNKGLCLKFNSNVQDWDKFVTDWARTGRQRSALVRDYCLDDPEWLNLARRTIAQVVRSNRENEPVAYDIRDELSTTISANPFDYDYNPIALDHFRTWLKTQYPSLESLNAQWDVHFASWSVVRPFTTDEIKNRMVTGSSVPNGEPDWQALQRIRFDPGSAPQAPTRWNFSPWADFRSYMDISLARALDALRQEAHGLDPLTPVGIEGTQMPHAFGGYDLWRLGQVLDWVEPYDIGCAREIFGSFMDDKLIMTTVFESDTRSARRRLWHLLLEGDKGCLVWWSEDCINWNVPEWPLTAKAKALAPVLHEMTGGLARLFLRAQREEDPIILHYSQPSIQVDWLLESTMDGSTWLRRFSSFEAEHNVMAKRRTAWLKALQDLGYTPRFISSAEVEMGRLDTLSNAVVVLANSWALSAAELRAFSLFIESGGNKQGIRRILAEGPTGVFDEHGKLRSLDGLGTFWQAASTNTGCLCAGGLKALALMLGESLPYLAERLKQTPGSEWLDWLKEQLGELEPEVTVAANTRTRIHRFRIKADRLVAFERNIEYQMSENLKQAGGNQALEVPVKIEARLRQPAHVYDLRAGTYLGLTNRIHFTLDAFQPSLFALLPEEVRPHSVLERLEREL
jgi:Beta-galactosidase